MENSFRKIDFNKDGKTLRIVNLRKKNRKKVFLFFLSSFFGFFLLLFPFLFIPFYHIYRETQETIFQARELYAILKSQDIELFKQKITEIEKRLSQIHSQFAYLSWTKILPFIGFYVKDSEHFLKASLLGVEAGRIIAETITPYADLLGLKGQSTFVAGSADERIRLAVETLDKVVPRLEEISVKIEKIKKELDPINPAKYPEKIGSINIRQNLVFLKEILGESASLFVDASPFLKRIPLLLGTKEPKIYLVLFQNDAELRATGGFITAYAIFRVDKGKLQVITADDIYKLDNAKRKNFPVPSPILKFHKDVTHFHLRDSNLSPDFVFSMQEFEKMLRESIPNFPKFEGIIALDTHVLVESVKILGEFNVYGRKFSAENDKRCDCPRVIYELEDYATRPVAYVREERKDIIGVLLYQIMQRALGVSPSQYWGKLFQMFLEEAKKKHILFYFHDEESQKGIERLNFAGRIIDAPFDYLHINNVNFAGAKSNMFIKTSVKQEINISQGGSIVKTVTITYKNPMPPSNCNLEAGELCLNGILRNWLRVYTPLGSELLEFKGSEKETATYNELGKTVFEGFLTVKPQGTAEIVIRYNLPFKVKKGEKYQLFIQKQPGTEGSEYFIFYNGQLQEQFLLSTDREVSFKW